VNKTKVFQFNGALYAVRGCAIYHWHGTLERGHVSNMPYASKRKTGWEPYMKSMGQRDLTQDEVNVFTKETENE